MQANVAGFPMEGRSVAAAAGVGLIIGGEPDVRSCPGAVTGAHADGVGEGATDNEAGRAALVIGLGEGCECEAAGGLVDAEAVAVDAGMFDKLARGPRVLRDEDVYGSSLGDLVLKSAASSRKEPCLEASGCFGDP
jgi:hypothetical protein